MNMPDNIKPKNDALRQVMRRRKERRPSMELPKEVEDRVMERIHTPHRGAGGLSLSILRSLSAAAAIAGFLVLAETMMPERQKEDIPAIVAKVEIHQPVEPGTNTKKEHPQTSAPDTRIAPQKKRGPSPKTVKADKFENVPHDPFEKTEVCINCELDAMADELTAMINEFENQ